MPGPNKQQLYVSNKSLNIGEALAARVKDPLWFLARQWQTGEFEAENGGALAGLEIASRSSDVQSVTLGKLDVQLDPAAPLEAIIEAETSGSAPAWRSEALEYEFGLETSSQKFIADSYSGFGLDWYEFDLESKTDGGTDDTPIQTIPTQINFKGAPHPKWWHIESGDAYFDSPSEAEPNILSALLPEFFYTDVENWYVAPTPMRSGSVREVQKVSVTDSFGISTEITPINDADWKVFSIDNAQGGTESLGGEYLFAPNIAVNVLHNDPIEDVRYIRDEQSNVVWAWEHIYTDHDGNIVTNGDKSLSTPPAQPDSNQELPIFKLSSDIDPHMIPYVPRFTRPMTDVLAPLDLQATPQVDLGKMYLRRGRTIESATLANPQYKSVIVADTPKLHEEMIPKTGARVRRLNRFARGSDGENYFWVGRHRDAGRGQTRSGLRFDYLEDDN